VIAKGNDARCGEIVRREIAAKDQRASHEARVTGRRKKAVPTRQNSLIRVSGFRKRRACGWVGGHQRAPSWAKEARK